MLSSFCGAPIALATTLVRPRIAQCAQWQAWCASRCRDRLRYPLLPCRYAHAAASVTAVWSDVVGSAEARPPGQHQVGCVCVHAFIRAPCRAVWQQGKPVVHPRSAATVQARGTAGRRSCQVWLDTPRWKDPWCAGAVGSAAQHHSGLGARCVLCF